MESCDNRLTPPAITPGDPCYLMDDGEVGNGGSRDPDVIWERVEIDPHTDTNVRRESLHLDCVTMVGL